jgi:hypothetical protein
MDAARLDGGAQGRDGGTQGSEAGVASDSGTPTDAMTPVDAAPGPVDAAPGSPDAAPGSPDAAAGSPDAAAGSPDAAPGSPDAAPGSPDAAPGPVDAAPGPVDAAPGSPDAAPGSPDALPAADASAEDALPGPDGGATPDASQPADSGTIEPSDAAAIPDASAVDAGGPYCAVPPPLTQATFLGPFGRYTILSGTSTSCGRDSTTCGPTTCSTAALAGGSFIFAPGVASIVATSYNNVCPQFEVSPPEMITATTIGLDPGICGDVNMGAGVNISGFEQIVLTSTAYPQRIRVTGSASVHYSGDTCFPPADDSDAWSLEAVYSCAVQQGGDGLFRGVPFCANGAVLTCTGTTTQTTSAACGLPCSP